MKRTAPITACLLVWAFGILQMNKNIGVLRPLLPAFLQPHLGPLSIPLSALTLLSSFVTLLLTYRTNQSLSRILEGRLAWGRAVLLTRDTAQLINAYIYAADKQLGLLAGRHLSLFGWLLKSRLRDEDDTAVINTVLAPESARYVAAQRKHPVALLTVIRQVVAKMAATDKINIASQMALEGNVLELNRIMGMCERIRMSPIPPMYTRHTSRMIMAWLFSLPLALTTLKISILTNLLITFSASFVILGLDEISMQLEQPFRLMPMQPLAAAVMRDVADAFVCQPPVLPVPEAAESASASASSSDSSSSSSSGSSGSSFERPSYWAA
jgi:predicted membrane chloride channel (bestrophin family)